MREPFRFYPSRLLISGCQHSTREYLRCDVTAAAAADAAPAATVATTKRVFSLPVEQRFRADSEIWIAKFFVDQRSVSASKYDQVEC